MSEITAPYISSVIKFGAHPRILDAGCGPGGLGAYLRGQGFKGRLVGVDKVAMGEAGAAHYDRFLEADLQSHEFDERFDAVVCSDVLECINDPGVLVKKLAALLSVGGFFYLAVPNVCHYEFISNFLLGTAEYDEAGRFKPSQVRLFNRISAARLMLDASLSVDDVVEVYLRDADKETIKSESKEPLAITNKTTGNRIMIPKEQIGAYMVSHYVLVGRKY